MLKVLSSLSLALCVTSALASSQPAINTSDFEHVYENAVRSNPAVKKIHEDALGYGQITSRDLGVLFDAVSRFEQTHDAPHDAPSLQAQVVASLEADTSFFEVFGQTMKNDPKNEQRRLIQLSTHKMGVVTQHALDLARQTEFFDLLLEEKLPFGYDLNAPVCNIFPNETHIYSNGRRGNALKALLLRAWSIQHQQTNLTGLDNLFGGGWIDRSTFVHVTPVPTLTEVPGFETSPYYFSDAKTPSGLLTIHNGYAFGGQRWETRYGTQGAAFGPQDCSSFVAKYLGSPYVFSTRDLLYLSEDVIGFPDEQLDAAQEAAWLASRSTEEAQSTLENLRKTLRPHGKIVDPASHLLRPGIVHNERTFNASSIQGLGGHTGIYLGTVGSGPDTKALTISANRDLEGSGIEFIYGVEARSFFSTKDRLVTYLEKKDN
ncbi:MAG: hypothetical protein C0514_01525 [Candidatus Puniceispirillum sp.]|nr:hypothetical protein [Candidatus Puniceispirillum sp.]